MTRKSFITALFLGLLASAACLFGACKKAPEGELPSEEQLEVNKTKFHELMKTAPQPGAKKGP